MTDQIQRFLFERTNVRGEIVTLERAFGEVLERHEYPPAVNRLLGELLAAVALLTDTVKLDGTLSIEVRGQGALSLLMAESNPGGELRAIARLAEEAAIPEGRAGFRELVGEGQIMITLDPTDGQRYQGIVALEHDSLSACLAAYFAQSEQLPTRFALSLGQSREPGGTDHWRAGGVMLQQLPKASPYVAGGGSGEGGLLKPGDIVEGEDAENWNRANHLLDTVEDLELIGPSVAPTDLLVRLFHEEAPRVYAMQPVRFGCTCSEDRVRNSLSIYSAKDIETMTTEEGIVTADCQFCGAHYRLDPTTLGFGATDSGNDEGKGDGA